MFLRPRSDFGATGLELVLKWFSRDNKEHESL